MRGGAPVMLYIGVPADPSLTSFVMSAVMAGKELYVHSGGWSFLQDDKPAPAVSHAGWQERFEPAFSRDMPILRIK